MATQMKFQPKSDSQEVPDRFKGKEVLLDLPDNRDEIRARIADGADPEKVLDGFIFGQGVRLTIQKWYKDETNNEKLKEIASPEEAIAAAVKATNERKFGEPRARGTGGGRKSKATAEAEAKAADATDALRATYLSVPKAYRKAMRDDLLNRGIFTEEQLVAMDAETGK